MRRITAVQSVVDQLRAEIANRYRPGDYLPQERVIAANFDVSRNTVREALIHLEAFGTIEKTRRGPRICTPDIDSVMQIIDKFFDLSDETFRDLLVFRRIIDLGSLPAVVERITDSDIERLQGYVEQLRSARTTRESAQADHEFHNLIALISGNSVVINLYRVLRKTLVCYLEIRKSDRNHTLAAVASHQKILDAFSQRSLPACQAAFEEHYADSDSELALRRQLARTAVPAWNSDVRDSGETTVKAGH